MRRSDLTAYPPDTSCSYCGEHAPVRVIDNDGYAPNELVCEDCFSHDLATWDDLPWPKFPKEE
jgi:hypothetical protein